MAAKRFNASALMTYSGQNLIRIVITSYFIATSLEIIYGTNAGVLLHWIVDPELAKAIGGGATFAFSFLLLCGFAMRLMALMLGLLIFWASFINAFMLHVENGVDNFWRDLALIAALMLTYLPHNYRDMRNAAMLRKHSKVRKMGRDGKEIIPRRVSRGAASRPLLPPVQDQEELSLRLRKPRKSAPAIPVEHMLEVPAPAEDPGPADALPEAAPRVSIQGLRALQVDAVEGEDVTNIFADPDLAQAS